MAKLPELNIGDLNIPVPIIQGGMGVRVSLARLAAAVANEGGVGTISAALIGGLKSNLTLDDSTVADIKELIAELRKASTLTTGVIAVNVMVALTNYSALVQAAAQNGAQIIVAGAGLPLTLPKLVEGTKAKIIPIVSSGRAADLICRTWLKKYDCLPDAIIVEGPKAGGHLGFHFEELEPESAMPDLGNIVSDVIQVAAQYGKNKKIPVIAAGGVTTGKDIAAMLKRGASGVQIATGDTKVVEKGKGDKIFINTSGIGICEYEFKEIQIGDKILLNGGIGEHEIAILTARESLGLETEIKSDCASLWNLISQVLKSSREVKFMRDPTRGGIATVLNEVTENKDFGILLYEEKIPVKEEVKGVCALLGFDPLYLANEGKVIIVVASEDADKLVNVLRGHSLGKDAQVIGEVVKTPAGKVYLKTKVGGTRIVDMLIGEQLPRIC